MKSQTLTERPTTNGPTPGLYPEDLEANIVTSSGRTFLLRPIRSDDDEKLVAFHDRLSEDTIYHRYRAPHPKLSVDEVAHLTRVDYINRLALVIEDNGEIIAVVRYDRYPGSDVAETAFVVSDDYQNMGLARHLLKALADAAAPRGVGNFRAETFSTNMGMLAVFRQSGFPLSAAPISHNETSVLFPIIHRKTPDQT
jgi:GNAT superfamily N-acetyltransferase